MCVFLLLALKNCGHAVKPGTLCTRCDVSRYLLKHAYSETHTHTLVAMPSCIQSSACVSWKIGLKAEPVARQRLFHIWCSFFFFYLSCSLFHTQTVSALPLM